MTLPEILLIFASLPLLAGAVIANAGHVFGSETVVMVGVFVLGIGVLIGAAGVAMLPRYAKLARRESSPRGSA